MSYLPSLFPEFAFYPPQNTISSLPKRKQEIEKHKCQTRTSINRENDIQSTYEGETQSIPLYFFFTLTLLTQNTSSQQMCGHLSPHQRRAPSSVVAVEAEGFPSHHQAKLRTLAGVPTMEILALSERTPGSTGWEDSFIKTAPPLPGGYLCSWHPDCRSEVPMIPSLFLILQPQVQVVTCISDYKSGVPNIHPPPWVGLIC